VRLCTSLSSAHREEFSKSSPAGSSAMGNFAAMLVLQRCHSRAVGQTSLAAGQLLALAGLLGSEKAAVFPR
jgi:uncharacterized membrane protein YebE (DUF533 family)